MLVLGAAEADTVGRAGHQAPEVDGECVFTGSDADVFAVGDLVRCRVVEARGVDLVVEPVQRLTPPGGVR